MFDESGQLQHLREWHTQWNNLSSKAQDSHLLWIFNRDEHSRDAASSAEIVGVTVETSSDGSSGSDSDSAIGCKVDTSPSGSGSGGSSSESDSGAKRDRAQPPPPKQRRVYNAGKTRRDPYSTSLLGRQICEKAAAHLLRVGQGRLRRVFDGREDGRTYRPHVPGPATSSVWSFLWTLYHHVAEGLPDKFAFAAGDVSSGVLASKTSKDTTRCVRVEPQPEEQIRAIAAHAVYVESGRCPAEAVRIGPGAFRGPLRFLHPGRRIHLFWEYELWAKAKGVHAASFSTFLRSFAKCEDAKILRIRSVGDHAVCSTCAEFKTALRQARFPADRTAILELYTAHVMGQWLDRQIYENATALSLECRKFLDGGQRFASMAASVSQICIAIDGMDQAKFRVPRVLIKTKAFEKLHRPALHVHGCWAHGFGYHLAVSDQDVKKDSVSNIEVLSRMLEQILVTHRGLPLGLHVQQDNCPRDCKNQNMMKWALKLVAMGVFKWVTLSFLMKGHTHIDIDGTYGQLTVRLSRHEFDDDNDVVNLLLKFLGDLGVEPASRRASLAYKLDDMPSWDRWWEEIDLKISSITGPTAPHWFKICSRNDLSESAAAMAEPFSDGVKPLPRDIMVCVKHHMRDEELLQVCAAVPEQNQGNLTSQPSGHAERRKVAQATRRLIWTRAEKLYTTKHISGKARDYLVEWAQETRVRVARPSRYAFLEHRFRPGGVPVDVVRLAGPRLQPNLMVVKHRGARGQRAALPLQPESDDDADENGVLVHLSG